MEANREFYESLDSQKLRSILEVAERYEPENSFNQLLEEYERDLLVAQENLKGLKRRIQLRELIRSIYNNKLKKET